MYRAVTMGAFGTWVFNLIVCLFVIFRLHRKYFTHCEPSPFPVKLTTIYKYFLCPYKRQSSMRCFIAFRYSGTCVKSRCGWNVPLGKLNYTNYQYITNTCACVASPHYFAWFFLCFPIAVKALLHGFVPIYNLPALKMCNVLMCPFSSQCNEA